MAAEGSLKGRAIRIGCTDKPSPDRIAELVPAFEEVKSLLQFLTAHDLLHDGFDEPHY